MTVLFSLSFLATQELSNGMLGFNNCLKIAVARLSGGVPKAADSHDGMAVDDALTTRDSHITTQHPGW